jgi:NitT/TauT family transport system ATP-binding protein
VTISVENLTLAKPAPDGLRTILHQVSFELAPGSRTAVIGASGCGKTSLLRILGGLDPPNTGTVLLDGAPADELRSRGRISMAFQEAPLLPWSSAWDNVLLPLRLRRRVGLPDRDRAAELLRLMEIDPDFWRARPPALSGGMRQRVALAAALVVQPFLLLLDEPFGSVDEITRFRLLDALDAVLARRRTTCVLVTHSVTEAVIFADRVLVLGGRPTSIVADIRVEAERPRTPGAVSRPPLAAIAAEALSSLGLG